MPYKDKEKEREYQRNHYLKHRDTYKKKARLSEEKLKREKRAFIWEYLLKNPCVDCGEADPVVLQFDHVDRTTKLGEIGKMIDKEVSWLRLKNEVAKCEVRCANCHVRRTASQFKWWKLEYQGLGSNPR